MREATPHPELRLRVVWSLLAGVHVVAAAYAWHMLPHGFAASQPHFWTNQVVPFVVAGAGIVCVASLWRRSQRVAAGTIAMFAGLHAGMATAWLLVFPITGGRPAKLAAALALAVCACAFAALRRTRGTRWPIAAGAVIGLALGCTLVRGQRGADARTHPAAPVRALVAPSTTTVFPPWVHLDAERGALALELDPVRIQLEPLLTFTSRSPDRGWTIFADAADRIGPVRRYAGAFRYEGPEPAMLHVSSTGDDVLDIDAETVLPAAVYSHLNSYCALVIHGHRRLFLAFSAIPSQRIEVTFSEYPVGRPARFAYVDAASELHVVEAESGEKGPFTELAHGPLTAPLAITLFDEDRAIARIELADFAAQASTQPSPTAGWGVPENAIELSLAGDRPGATAYLYMTLAGTSVGRGWDSVGHAPGLYRNRMTIRRRP